MSLDSISTALWSDIIDALDIAGGNLPQLPEIRSEYQDWVRDGVKLPR